MTHAQMQTHIAVTPSQLSPPSPLRNALEDRDQRSVEAIPLERRHHHARTSG